MQHKRLVNALKKRGLVPKQIEGRPDMWYAEGPKYVCEWFVQSHDSTRAHCVNVRRHDDHSDSMTDYHAGTFARTIEIAVEWTAEGLAPAQVIKTKQAMGLEG